MKRNYFYTLMLATTLFATTVNAQDTTEERVAHASSGMVAHPKTDRTLTFDVTAAGEKLPVIWGMDTAWPDEGNVLRGVSFIGKEVLGTARGSFQPRDLIVDGQLSARQKEALDNRLRLIGLTGVKDIALNCDHEVLCNEEAYPDAKTSYKNYYGKPEEWAKLIEASVLYCQEKGFNVVSVAPFNEPDYTPWKEGTKEDFKNIAKLLKANPLFENIRICGGNTLNCDEALPWYNYMKDYLDEGNTHQLAGSFDNYAKFFETVRNDGKHGTADELHNVMEAMVGVEYGMHTGIWWGFDGLARGEFCRASNLGERLAYAEDRPHWTAASVYRNNEDGRVQAFLGTSERQANNSSYRFVSTERDVFFDGQGPTREYVVEMPGGNLNSYQNGQTNAEKMVNITWGEDVAPYIDGDYMIMNVYSGKVISLASATPSNGSVISQKKAAGTVQQIWSVKPNNPRIGGDFSYHTLISVDSMSMDVVNWSLSAGSDIKAFRNGHGANQQWYLKYAGDGNFYIVNRHSNLYLTLQRASKSDGIAITHKKKTVSKTFLWRFVPVGAVCELNAPVAPTGLTAVAQSASIRLDWTANTEEDLASYTIVRAENTDGELAFNTVARNITATAFVDNTVEQGVEYVYKIKAVDKTGNISESSETVIAKTADVKTLVAQLQFENNLYDCTDNMFDPVTSSMATYTNQHKSGEKALAMTSGTQFLQLPYQLGNMWEMTICTWVNMRSSSNWQRIFDFGNDTEHYMFLTPNNGSEMRFVMKNGGDEEILSVAKLGVYTWAHIAVTISDEAVTLYLDGKEVAKSTTMTIRPSDIKPVCNYIGRSQYDSDPMLKAYLDDFRIYNYALSADEVLAVTKDLANSIDKVEENAGKIVSVEYYTVGGMRISSPKRGITIVKTHFADGSYKTDKIYR